jgi:hypothetical protein
MNEYLYVYGENTHINYDTTSEYNYQYANLQSGDNYGLCFVFPFIIWYNIIYEINRVCVINNYTNTNKSIYLSSSRKLLENKKLFEFINKAFIMYDSSFERIIYDTITNTASIADASKVIEEFIERKGTLFLKKIIGAIVSFVGQKLIKDKLNIY